MANTGLDGPFALTDDSIDRVVTRTSPGTYVLGLTENGTFYVNYVGRSDSDVNDRLHDHVGRQPQFKFGYFQSPKAAFERECRIFHDFNPPGNKAHPSRPNNSGWKCPYCRIFG